MDIGFDHSAYRMMDAAADGNLAANAPSSMSRTHQYRKVMKPLLERKRRARINKCLDELKDLMVYAMQSEGESITKLEKADVLELTVRHMQKLKAQNALGLTPQATYAGKFKAGYTHCAQEVSRYMEQNKGRTTPVSSRLLTHLHGCVLSLESLPPSSAVAASTSLPLESPPPPPLSSPPQDKVVAVNEAEEEALDLSNKSRRSSFDEDEAVTSRKLRQPSNDSDSGNSSMAPEKSDWRPW